MRPPYRLTAKVARQISPAPIAIAPVSRRQRLRGEIKPEHAAIHFVHVHQAPGYVTFISVLGRNTADGHPTDPVMLALRAALAALDERAVSRIGRQLQANPNLLIGANPRSRFRPDANAAGGNVHDLAQRLARPLPAVPALNRNTERLHRVPAIFGDRRHRLPHQPRIASRIGSWSAPF